MHLSQRDDLEAFTTLDGSTLRETVGPARTPARNQSLRMPTLRTLAILAVLGAALGCAAPARALTVGIADNKPDMFFDPRFAAAGISQARLSVGWDALTSPWQTEQLDQWLNAARAAHVD